MGDLGDQIRQAADVADDLEIQLSQARQQASSDADRIAELQSQLADCRAQSVPPAKPIVAGIFSRNSVPPRTDAPISAATVQIYWNELEQPDGTLDFTPLLEHLNDADAKGWPVRVRPMLGRYAPDRVKRLAGGPLSVFDPQGGQTFSCSVPWAPAVLDEGEKFLRALGALVDGDPRVCAVYTTLAMTVWGEPCLRQLSNPDNRQRYLALGYSASADLAAQLRAIEVMRAFSRTPVGLAFNPYQYLDDSGALQDRTPTDLMDALIDVAGGRTILANNSIRTKTGWPKPDYQALYDAIRARPQAAHQFQCAGVKEIGDEAATIRWAIDTLGANGIEWTGTLTDAQYAAFDTELKEAA